MESGSSEQLEVGTLAGWRPYAVNTVLMLSREGDGVFTWIFCILIFLVAVIAVLAMINRPFLDQLLVKFRGRTDAVMERDASTPEGARDYYNAAIREREDIYNRASASFAEISGRLDAAEKELYQLKKDLAKVVSEINRSIDALDDDSAMAYARKKTTLESKIEVLKETIEELKEAKAYQEELRDTSRAQLEDLKEEKERVLYQLEADSQVIRLHEGMDALNTSSESDRMLQRAREGAEQTRRRASGARIAYESSAEAQDRRLEQESRERQAREVVEEMKRKRGV